MSVLSNKFIGYLDRSAEQQKEAILSKINAPGGLPEMTDHTEGNPWIANLDIWWGISENWHYYIDTAAQDSFITVAEDFKSVALRAQEFDYRIKGFTGSSVGLLFTLSQPAPSQIVIPINTQVNTKAGIQFFTTEAATIEIGETNISVPARQEVQVTGVIIGQTTGQVSQIITVDGNIVDQSFQITIQSVGWFGQETFAFSSSTDLHYVAGITPENIMGVEFGDGVMGKIPVGAQDVIASYRTTSGASGNVAGATITEIVSAITLPGGYVITCTNVDASTGGYDAEDLITLKKRIPLSLRTLYKAVTKADYKAITEMANGVARAGVVYACGKVIDIYITPEGSTNGIASQSLIDDTQDYIDLRKMITTQVSVKSAGIVHMLIEFDVVLLPNYVNAAKKIEGKQRLADFLNIQTQEIYGTVEIGDLYEIIETMPGVKNSRLKKITTQPYARPINHDVQLLWTRVVKTTSVKTVKWKIVKSNSTHFQLLKEGAFIGTYAFGDVLSFAELTFTVQASGSYSNGNTWEFVTYKYNDNIALEEPSVPISDIADIVLNVTGGI